MGGAGFEIDLDAVQAAEGELPLDELFDALSNPLARYTLYYLADQPAATLDELTDVVTGLEAATADTVATPTDHDRVRLHLHHVVLPKLDDLGYLEFDTTTLTVSRSRSPTLAAILQSDG